MATLESYQDRGLSFAAAGLEEADEQFRADALMAAQNAAHLLARWEKEFRAKMAGIQKPQNTMTLDN